MQILKDCDAEWLENVDQREHATALCCNKLQVQTALTIQSLRESNKPFK